MVGYFWVGSVDIYRKGITGKMAEFAVKKYKSHRRVSDSIYNEIGLYINK